MSHIEIGKADGHPFRLDIGTLVATRLLIQASSGGGKSWTLRRLLEQSHGQIQHIVLDPEGEFGSLRERYPYVLAGKGGDIASDPKTAPLLAHRLLELRASAVLDLYELKARERAHFVKVFLESLINAPKALWHPVLVVIDEAHVYAPEKGDAESAEDVIGLCTRGRKRGFCAVLATQRLANLSKQAAAQCLNVMVGPTFLDVDRKRAVEVLGVTGAEEKRLRSGLMQMQPGQFWAIGRAFTIPGLSQVTVGPVHTHHPEIAGSSRAQLTPPPPPEKVRAVLSKLADLPKEAEDERTREARLTAQVRELQGEVKRLERELTSQRQADPALSEEERHEARQAKTALAGADILLRDTRAKLEAIRTAAEEGIKVITGAADAPVRMPPRGEKSLFFGGPKSAPAATVASDPKPATARQSVPLRATGTPRGNVDTNLDNDDYRPRAGARRMLEALARYHQGVMTAAQLRTMARLRKSGTSGTYLRELRHHELVEGDDGALRITQAGLDMVGMAAAQPLTAEEVLDHWRERFRAGARRMLDALVDDRGRGMTREQLGEATDLEPTSGTFGTYLGELRRNGLAVERSGVISLAEDLR